MSKFRVRFICPILNQNVRIWLQGYRLRYYLQNIFLLGEQRYWRPLDETYDNIFQTAHFAFYTY